MKWSEKYEYLSKLYDNNEATCIEENFEIVKNMSSDPSPLIRSLVARVCSIYNSFESIEVLLSLSEDANKLVRVEVADSLSSFSEESAYQKLVDLCSDSYYMVRGYAEYGIGLIGNIDSRKKQAIEIISENLKKERYYFNRLQCYMAMHFFGDEKALQSILQVYHRLKYQDKCLVLNFMIEILSKKNCEVIFGFFSKVHECGIPSVDLLIDKLLSIRGRFCVSNTGDGSLIDT